MKKIFNDRLKRGVGRLLMLTSLFAVLIFCFSCKESERFEIAYTDSEPPDPPRYRTYVPLNGGARIYFYPPQNEDVLSIDATYVNDQGKTVWFSVSYFQDTINIYGLSDTLEHTVSLYSVDRAGNKSSAIDIPIKPLEPAFRQIARSMVIKPGFASFFMEWENMLRQNVNVYAEFDYVKNGQTFEHKLIYTSNLAEERWSVRDLEPDSVTQQPITLNLKVRVEDYYGNMTEYIDKGTITLLKDDKIPKTGWSMPAAGTYMGDVPMGYLSGAEGRAAFVIDDIIDDGKNMNYGHTDGKGRTGLSADGNQRWNIMIDLGAEYELSRIITHQRFYNGDANSVRGQYYGGENIGTYAMYIWDDERERWDSISGHTISFVEGLSDMEYRQMGLAGDMAYLYPDDPHFTRPTRWFRYEAWYAFGWTTLSWLAPTNCISEITLYGRKH